MRTGLEPMKPSKDHTHASLGRIEDSKALDYFQPPTIFDEALDAYKEWQHFSVFDRATNLFALFNFSVSGNPFDSRSAICARTTVIRTPEGAIIGAIEPLEVDGVKLSHLDPGIAFRGVSVTYGDSAYRVFCDMETVPVRADLSLQIASEPFTTHTRPFGTGFLGWTVFPRMKVTGRIWVSEHEYRIRNASGYHDHDWGRFYWGERIGWNWGIFLEDRASGITILFDQSTTGIGSAAITSGLLIYKGNTLFKSFSETEVSVDFAGTFGKNTITFPGLFRAAYHKASCQLPEEITLKASAPTTGRIVVKFKPDCVVQLIAPNHCGPGETQLNQMVGKIEIHNSLKGIVMSPKVRGYMEFVGPLP